MASKLDQAAKDAFGLSASATNGTATITVTAPAASTLVTTFVTGVQISASAAPAAAVTATLAGVLGADGTAKTISWQIPASAFAPLTFNLATHPLKALPGTNLVLSLPALGGSTVGTVTLFYYFGTI